MKRIYIAIICMLPFTGLAQAVIKEVQLPNLPVDFATKLRTLRVDQAEPGAKKEKLTVLMSKWLNSKYTSLNSSTAMDDTSAAVINGQGFFLGACPIERQQYDMNATDRVSTRQTPVDYKIHFNIKIAVTAGKYAIVVDNIKLEYLNVTVPLEVFYDRELPNILIPDEDRGLDVLEMYNRMFSDIDRSLKSITVSASKYVAKAQKRGDI